MSSCANSNAGTHEERAWQSVNDRRARDCTNQGRRADQGARRRRRQGCRGGDAGRRRLGQHPRQHRLPSMRAFTRCSTSGRASRSWSAFPSRPPARRSISTAPNARPKFCAWRSSATRGRCATRKSRGCFARSCRPVWRSRNRSRWRSWVRKAPSPRPPCSSTSAHRCGRCRCRRSTRCFTKSKAASPISAWCPSRTPARARSITPSICSCRRRSKICGEVELRINHYLMGKMSDIDAVKRVCAHPQALAQCRGWLDDQLAGCRSGSACRATPRARGARATSAAPRPSPAARRPRSTDSRCSPTRSRIGRTTPRAFWWWAESCSAPAASIAPRCWYRRSDTDDAGALFRLLEPLAQHRVNMTRIESRPSRKRKWDYVFFIDIEGHVSDPPVAKALAALEQRASLFKVLGSYPRAVL